MTNATAKIMGRLRDVSLPIMSAYQTDLDHDEAWIDAHPGEPFIHICTDTSTHLFPCAQDYGTNEQQRHLFGRATPRQIFAGYLSCMKMLATRDPVRFHYFHSTHGLVSISAVAARKYYAHHIAGAEQIMTARRRAN